jgi:hypothetical protein
MYPPVGPEILMLALPLVICDLRLLQARHVVMSYHVKDHDKALGHHYCLVSWCKTEHTLVYFSLYILSAFLFVKGSQICSKQEIISVVYKSPGE